VGRRGLRGDASAAKRWAKSSGEGDILLGARRLTATVDTDERLQTLDSTGFAAFCARSPCYDRALIFMRRQV
jgi:hypothetical protein